MANTKRANLSMLVILAILTFGTIMPALVYAAPLGSNGKDWMYTNGNSWAWNYSPETQITKSNVQNLEVKWVFPVASKELAPAAIRSLTLNEGVATPVLVRNGKIFFTTNWLRTYALDAKTGKQLWINDYTINATILQQRLPLRIGSVHLHAIRYWEAEEAVLINGMACDFYALDANTGQQKFHIEDLCLNVPGTINIYSPAGASIAAIGTYEKGRQLIYSLNGNTGGWNAFGRNFVMGIDAASRQVVWRVFNQPPQDTQVKDWALEECDIGWFRDIPCSDVAARARANLEWDWAFPNEVPSKWGGVGSNWGQPVVDEDTGFLYLQTGNQSPYTNVSLTPGPRLYGSTIMAIDMNAGKRAWWEQPMPHDPYDYDCNWAGILAESTQIGKVYLKGCKEGILFAHDAKTGKPVWTQDVLEELYPGARTAHITDPFSTYDMREWKWPENSRYHGPSPFVLNPSYLEGTFGTDMSYDPNNQTIFHYDQNAAMIIQRSLPLQQGSSAGAANYLPVGNTTIVARDLATGKTKWTYFYQFSAQRSHMVVTPELLFSAFTDGTVKFFDKDTGRVLGQVIVGSGVYVGPTIGADSDGNQKIFISMGGIPVIGGRAAPYAGGVQVSVVPGTIVAIGLSERAGQGGATTVTTATTTTTTTVISTQPGQTTTITSQVTGAAGGLPVEVTYAAIAIAVIAIIAAAVLATRRRV